MLRRQLGAFIGALALAISMGGAIPAYADGWGSVDCSKTPNAPECEVTAGIPGRPTGGGATGEANGGTGSGSGDGQTSPCRYEAVADPPRAPTGAGPGGWYVQVCEADGRTVVSTARWLPAGQVADPQALAQVAVSRLRLPSPVIRRNPDSATGVLVRVPVWLWVDESTWGTRSATASVPGMSVTATATPTSVVWSPGDRTADVVCQGPGQPWRPGTDPRAASPCGHTYLVGSAGEPGNAFVLRAMVTWTVSWTGGGQNGTVPPLTTTAAVRLPVAQSQAVVGGNR
jgi:hypothetical protein